MKLLLHTCCGPCTPAPLDALRSEGFEVFGLFYNPNIHPFTEHRKRLDAARSLAELNGFNLIVREDYDLEGFLREVVFRESQRCIFCYERRLAAAARLAKKSGMDAFTTTLLYSKHQKHDLVAELAQEAARKHGVEFLYRDFRGLWKEGIEKYRATGLYRQNYCGCIFSERERYLGPIEE